MVAAFLETKYIPHFHALLMSITRFPIEAGCIEDWRSNARPMQAILLLLHCLPNFFNDIAPKNDFVINIFHF
jgi:hypothetical protein